VHVTATRRVPAFEADAHHDPRPASQTGSQFAAEHNAQPAAGAGTERDRRRAAVRKHAQGGTARIRTNPFRATARFVASDGTPPDGWGASGVAGGGLAISGGSIPTGFSENQLATPSDSAVAGANCKFPPNP
jgi:hypothetical protein